MKISTITTHLLVGEIDICVKRKRIKHMHLYVKPAKGIVEISAPHRLTDESISLFALSHISWIRKKLEEFRHQPKIRKREYISGESFYLWGKKYYLNVIHENRATSLYLEGEYALLFTKAETTFEKRKNFIKEWYRRQLTKKIEELLPKLVAKTGLTPSAFQTKDMKTKWGTCNTKTRKIWLNLQLVQRPVHCLEYVLLHEIAHLQERNHGTRFKALLDLHMPLWREVRKELNSQNMISL